MTAAVIDLHCAKRRHARLVGDRIIEIHCRWCSAVRGYAVYHRFDKVTGELIDDECEREDSSSVR